MVCVTGATKEDVKSSDYSSCISLKFSGLGLSGLGGALMMRNPGKSSWVVIESFS